MRNRTSLVAATVALTVTASLAAVGVGAASANASSTPTAPAGANATLWKELPKSIQKSKTITLGTTQVLNSSGLPVSGLDQKNGKTIIGIDADVRNAVAKVLGINFKITYEPQAQFAALPTNVNAGKYQLIQGNLGITAAREQVIHFASYGAASEDVLVGTSSPLAGKKVTSLTDLCGHSVVSIAGILPSTILNNNANLCSSKGLKSWNNTQVTSDASAQATVVTGLTQGRYDAYFAPQNTVAAIDQADASIKDIGTVAQLQVGFGFPLNSSGKALAKVIADAINVLIKNGTYKKIYSAYSAYQAKQYYTIAKSQVDPKPAV